MALGDSRYALGLSSPVNPIVASRSSPKPYACLYASANKFPDVPREGRFSNPLISQPPHLPTVRMTLRTPLRWGGPGCKRSICCGPVESTVGRWNLLWSYHNTTVVTILLWQQHTVSFHVAMCSPQMGPVAQWNLLWPTGTLCGHFLSQLLVQPSGR